MTLENRAGDNVDSNYQGLSHWQNRSILIAGLSCACFSLAASLITLRWFLLMKRTFRHRLILFLIISDTFKALWYFIFPVVVFSRGMVSSGSAFCQASGFFLSVGIEGSDFAILMIALHSIIYIFHPPTKAGESGGLYRWRNWIYPFWFGLPVIAASLAFINNAGGYSSAGTFCYLPKRPIWYRLALAWVPRYLIISTIFGMYLAVYIYVSVKFRSFSNLADSGSQYESASASASRRSSIDEEVGPDELPLPEPLPPPPPPPVTSKRKRPGFSRGNSFKPENEDKPEHRDPWDDMSFITAKPLHQAGPGLNVQAADFAPPVQQTKFLEPPSDRNSGAANMFNDPFASSNRKVSSAPTMNTSYTGETMTTASEAEPAQQPPKRKAHGTRPSEQMRKDPLRATRKAIRRQLRYLFIYPAVYVFMWTFPFVAHCFLYSDHYAAHPIYWLSVVQTCCLALQAGVDGIVFSWSEKPWRRIPDDSRFTVHFWRSSYKARNSEVSQSNKSSVSTGLGHELDSGSGAASGQTSRATSTHWWEAEGKKRKDSVWLGIDVSNVTNLLPGRRATAAHVNNSVSVPEAVPEEREPRPRCVAETEGDANVGSDVEKEFPESPRSKGEPPTDGHRGAS